MRCPICKTCLIITQDLDHSHEAGNEEVFWIDVTGKCETCGHKYIWTQYYTLQSEDNLEDDE